MVTAFNIFYYAYLVTASKISGILNDSERLESYSADASRVKNSIDRLMWNDEKGVYIDCNIKGIPSESISEQTNILAMLYDVAGWNKSQRIRRFLESKVNIPRSDGPYFDFYILNWMFKNNRSPQALDRIRWRWGLMLKHGATTWWEHLDEKDPIGRIQERSLCHAYSTAPNYVLPAYVLGVRPLKQGFEEFTFEPNTGDLTWAQGTIPTPSGDIKVEWKKSPSGLTATVECPDNLSAVISGVNNHLQMSENDFGRKLYKLFP